MAQFRQSGQHFPNGSDHVSVGVRGSSSSQHLKSGRGRRSGRSDKGRFVSFSIGAVVLFLCAVLVVTVLAYNYLSAEDKGIGPEIVEDDESKSDLDFLTNVTRTESVKVLEFGQGSVVHAKDSRYWDRDDRRRDEDYDEDDVEHTSDHSTGGSDHEQHDKVDVNDNQKKSVSGVVSKGLDQKGIGMYNENGRKELKKYEVEYEASLRNRGQSMEHNGGRMLDDEDLEEQHETADGDNDYDDGIDSHDARGDGRHLGEDTKESSGKSKDQHIGKDIKGTSSSSSHKGMNSNSNTDPSAEHANGNGQSSSKSKSESKKKPRRRKFSGSCEMKFLNYTQLVEPFDNRKFSRFALQYTDIEERPAEEETWEPKFAGHQSLEEREDSFSAQDQKIKCGFVKGPEGYPNTGFDLSEDDTSYISRCHIAVISCIFGNSDRLRSPFSKAVTRLSRKNVCFVMFVDETTLRTLTAEGHIPDRAGFIGLWKIVVVKNLPYNDMRRVGKIPKLLPHRLFPSARYSIWLDSKLRLQLDPLLVLEYLLWRKGYEYAISNHYDRHCVWEEVVQNKRLNKYNHTIIDEQFAFYKTDGLTRFNASDPTSADVPEGSLIVRAHTPMSNLFSCLWFNEVERFTPRDQLSFAYTYQKLRRMNPGKPFSFHMFKVNNHFTSNFSEIVPANPNLDELTVQFFCRIVKGEP
ncbi:Probable hexosyltransferase MUCI70 [Linum perenne]